MEETFSVMRANVTESEDVKSITSVVEDLPLECGNPIQGKNRKKKKKQNGPQAPSRIVDFNSYELMKLDEEKRETKNSTAKQSSNIITADCSVSDIKETNADVGDCVENFSSSPQKSALRGAYEKLGFGPRPKMHVKWDSSVWEPPSSIVSHTVNKNQPKKSYTKKDMKNGRNERSNNSHNRKKQGKKKPQLATSRNFVEGDHEQLPGGTLHRNDIFLDCDTVVTVVEDYSPENELESTETISLMKNSAQACAVPLMRFHTPCSLIYGQAM